MENYLETTRFFILVTEACNSSKVSFQLNRMENHIIAHVIAMKSLVFFLYKQTFSDKSTHDKKQYFVTHLHKSVTVFKKSTQKINIFYFKIAKSRSTAVVSVSRSCFFCITATLPYEKKYPPSKLYVFE